MLDGPFLRAKKIIDLLEERGHQAYFVGGSVRDLLLQRSIGDIDITTSALPEQVQAIFPKVIPVGIEHGTVIVRMAGQSYEVTTFRVEGNYSDYRHPDHVQYVDRIEEDLARRDFTINGIAMDKHGKILDPFGGKQAIENQLIQTVGTATERFKEDPLRMMRALRFASQLGFSLEAATFAALTSHINWLEKIAIERIAVEMQKLFSGDHVEQAIKLLLEVELERYLPVIRNQNTLVGALNNHQVPLQSWSEMLACFCQYDPSVSLHTWTKEWKLSNKTKQDASYLLEAIDYFNKEQLDAWLVYRLPEHLESGFLRLLGIFCPELQPLSAQLCEIRECLPVQSRQEIVMDGNDLISLFPQRSRGPWLNTVLQLLEEHVVLGKVANEKQQLKAWVTNEIYPTTLD